VGRLNSKSSVMTGLGSLELLLMLTRLHDVSIMVILRLIKNYPVK